MSIEENSLIKIHSYKHDKSIHRVWNNVTVLQDNGHEVVLGNYKTRVVESNGRYWNTKEPAICFFYDDRWYNVIAMLKNDGIYYYCNISSPCVYDGEAIKYIDYDLDLRIDADYNYKILDMEEYNYHANLMNYSEKLKFVIEENLKELIKRVEKREGPFSHEMVKAYYELYKELNDNI